MKSTTAIWILVIALWLLGSFGAAGILLEVLVESKRPGDGSWARLLLSAFLVVLSYVGAMKCLSRVGSASILANLSTWTGALFLGLIVVWLLVVEIYV